MVPLVTGEGTFGQNLQSALTMAVKEIQLEAAFSPEQLEAASLAPGGQFREQTANGRRAAGGMEPKGERPGHIALKTKGTCDLGVLLAREGQGRSPHTRLVLQGSESLSVQPACACGGKTVVKIEMDSQVPRRR